MDRIIGTISVGYHATGQLLITFLFFHKSIWEKNWKYNERVYSLIINFKVAYESVRRLY
jgi:hypothetical protein